MTVCGCTGTGTKANILNIGAEVASKYGDPGWKQMHCAFGGAQFTCTTTQHVYRVTKDSSGNIARITRVR